MKRNNHTTVIKADIFDHSGRLLCRCREPARRFVSRKAESEGRSLQVLEYVMPSFFLRNQQAGTYRTAYRAGWEDTLNPPVDEDGYRITNAADDAEESQSSDLHARPQTPPQRFSGGMATPRTSTNEANDGDDRRTEPSTPSSSFIRRTESATPTTPSNPNRSRFMKPSSTPESAAAAVAKRSQARNQAIAATVAQSKASAATSASSSMSSPQPAGTKARGGFTPQLSTQINRSNSNTDTTSMDFEYENDVDMDNASTRGETTPNTSHTSENMSSLKRQEERNITIDAEGSPKKRSRGSDDGDRWKEENPFAGLRARPLIPEYAQPSKPESPSRGSTAQVEDMLTQPPNGSANASSSGPSTSRPTNSMPPPPTSPGRPRTPSSTNASTDTHIMNLEALIEHLRMLERRRAAAEQQSAFWQNRARGLEKDNAELKSEVERLQLEKLEKDAQHESDQSRITKLLLENQKLRNGT
ncbi:hypothetical protein FRC01_002851 [Tulasnella sp. 417]|nr:hypothetical protein FRC01_002851 [Tulasnella sp. 417]